MKECNECKKEFEPYTEVEINGKICQNFGEGSETSICKECMGKGWTTTDKETLEALRKDDGFNIAIRSPYGFKKY